MNKTQLAHIELTFNEEDKIQFYEFVDNLINPDDFYVSPIIPRINGNVCRNLHSTLFYGLDTELEEDPRLLNLLDEFNVSEIKLGNYFLLNGFQGLYKILCLEIKDEDMNLRNFSDSVSKLTTYKYDFKPHITLAYVIPDFDINSINKKLPQNVLKVKGVSLFH